MIGSIDAAPRKRIVFVQRRGETWEINTIGPAGDFKHLVTSPDEVLARHIARSLGQDCPEVEVRA